MKEKIAQEKGWEAKDQKLIYSGKRVHAANVVFSACFSFVLAERAWDKTDNPPGKILKDEDTVESYKIEEKGFVVCMVNKVSQHHKSFLLSIQRLSLRLSGVSLLTNLESAQA